VTGYLPQHRYQPIDLLHLVQEEIRTSGLASFAHGREIEIGEHDNPDMASAVIPGLGGTCCPDDGNPASRSELQIDDDDIRRSKSEFVDCFGLPARIANDFQRVLMAHHVFEAASKERRVLDQEDSQVWVRRFPGSRVRPGWRVALHSSTVDGAVT